jgi:hypothetical protein
LCRSNGEELIFHDEVRDRPGRRHSPSQGQGVRPGPHVPGEQAAQEPVDSVDVKVAGQFLERDDQRRVADDLANSRIAVR